METNTESIEVIAQGIELVKYGAIVLGITEIAKKWVPEASHDRIIPTIALVLGVSVVCGAKLLAGEPVTLEDIGVGVILGGTTTGLYAVTKDIKQY